MHSRTALHALAATLLASFASGHISMTNPVPFSADKVDLDPITALQYPCKSHLGFNVTTQNAMAVGEEQKLVFKGTAVHGGGSCQLSITADKVPTPQSKFKVIKSIQGGCPGVDGATKEYAFTLPPEVPNGDVTFAWTWFAKMSGVPELYMNCAPVTVSGGSDDPSAMDSLPDMFFANIDIAPLLSPQNFDTEFPDPGDVVEAAPAAELASPSPNPKYTGGAVQPPPPAGGSAAPVPGASTPAGGNNGQPTPAPPANTGVVLAPGASSGAPAQPTATLTTLVTVTGGTPGQTSVAIPAVPSTPPAAPTGTPVAPANPPAAPSSPPAAPPTNGGGAGACTNGALVCNGPNQWGLCNHGSVVFGPVSDGTICANGQITNARKRFARAHKRHFHGLEHRY